MVHKLTTRRITSILLGLLLAVSVVLTACPRTLADPPNSLASKSAQARRVQNEIDSLDRELAIATESYNLTKSQLEDLSKRVIATRKELNTIRDNLAGRRQVLNERAVQLYKNGRTGMLEILLKANDFAEFLQKADYVYRVAESDARLVEEIKASRDSVMEIEQQLSIQERQQNSLLKQEEEKRIDIETRLAERQGLLDSLNADIQRLIDEMLLASSAQSQQYSEEARAALANDPDAAIAQEALKYLGVPYHWAGEGPGRCPNGTHAICFDCSGYTMYVYRKFGVSLVHYAATQFNQAKAKITLSQARAGDLVFFGSPIHHVGMYLGNDLYVHAPQTGDVVKVSRLSSRRDLTGIGRY